MNYIGAAGPVAVKWGGLGEVTEGERAVETGNPLAASGDIESGGVAAAPQRTLATPEKVPTGAGGGPSRFWIGVLLGLVVVVSCAAALADKYD